MARLTPANAPIPDDDDDGDIVAADETTSFAGLSGLDVLDGELVPRQRRRTGR